ncbi:MAG: hypothetical protein Q8P93_03065 [bacterium]|nr:hypothetical protein [bacterium]
MNIPAPSSPPMPPSPPPVEEHPHSCISKVVFGVIAGLFFGIIIGALAAGLGADDSVVQSEEERYGTVGTIIENLEQSRIASYDAAVKSNLSSIRTSAEVYFYNELSYGLAFAIAPCPATGNSMFATDIVIQQALVAAKGANGGSDPICAVSNNGTRWAAWSPLRGTGAWCVDSTGYSGNAKGIVDTECSKDII